MGAEFGQIAPAQCCVPLGSEVVSDDDARATAALFKALADPTRVRIVNLLVNSPEATCACDLNEHFELSQPTMSFHLKKLVTAGLLRREQRGTWAYFSIEPEAMERLAAVVTTKESVR